MNPTTATVCVLALSFAALSCGAREPVVVREGGPDTGASREPRIVLPEHFPQELVDSLNREKDRFFEDLDEVLRGDTEGLLLLADKKHSLGSDYIPEDIIPLTKGRAYIPGREGLSLRSPAEEALHRMALAAKEDGVSLVVSSSYRSYEYQRKVYDREVRLYGQETADRQSARPGTSQHQLGTAVDFGSITDAFADTAAGKWMTVHGPSWGWSLSFPEGYEKVTGYRWESWHWRYVGERAAAFQKRWFNDVQQYMLEFIDAWRQYSAYSAEASSAS